MPVIVIICSLFIIHMNVWHIDNLNETIDKSMCVCVCLCWIYVTPMFIYNKDRLHILGADETDLK